MSTAVRKMDDRELMTAMRKLMNGSHNPVTLALVMEEMVVRGIHPGQSSLSGTAD